MACLVDLFSDSYFRYGFFICIEQVRNSLNGDFCAYYFNSFSTIRGIVDSGYFFGDRDHFDPYEDLFLPKYFRSSKPPKDPF